MIDYYVIYDLNNGYWCESTESFRGFLFASKYLIYEKAENQAMTKASKVKPCSVIKIYDK